MGRLRSSGELLWSRGQQTAALEAKANRHLCVNKVLLELSHAPLFVSCVCLCLGSSRLAPSSWDRDPVVARVANACLMTLFRKSLLTPALELGSSEARTPGEGDHLRMSRGSSAH